jgi:PKD repeat protein
MENGRSFLLKQQLAMRNFSVILCLLLCALGANAARYVRYNYAGYDPVRPKVAIVMADDNCTGFAWALKNSSNVSVANGTLGASSAGAGNYMPKAFNYNIDFTSIQTIGTYTLEVANIGNYTIEIKCQPYKEYIHNVLRTIRVRRSGSSDALDHGLSHTGDASCSIYRKTGANNNNSSWTIDPGNKKASMVGGHYDAGDYIKFTLTEAYLVYFLLRSYQTAPELFDGVKTYSTTPYDDMLDECKWGLDYLMKTLPDANEFIIQVGGYQDHNQGNRLPENDALNGSRQCYSEQSKTQMGYTAAALALGAKVFGDKGYTTLALQYQTKAIEIYAAAKASTKPNAWWQANNLSEVFYADDTPNDNMELAAVELYRLTNQATYLTDANTYATAAGPAYWASWGNVNMFAHARLYPFNTSVGSLINNDLSSFNTNANNANNLWRLPHASVWGSLYSQLICGSGAIQYQNTTGATTYSSMGYNVIDYLFGRNPWGLGFIATQNIPNTVKSSYAQIYKLQPTKFPFGEIAAGPAPSSDHSAQTAYFSPAHNANLWHKEFNTANFTFFEQPGDYVCMETTIVGLGDGIFLLTQASKNYCTPTGAIPVANFTASVSTICNGQTVTYTNTTTNSPTTLSWNFGAGASPATATGVGPHTVTYTGAGNKTVQLTATNASGSDDEIKTNFITVNASVTPTVSAATPNTTICAGASALFTATPTNGGTTPAYQWTKNGTNISGATSATYSTTVIANNDQFRVVMTSSETCKSAATTTSAPVTMTVTPSVTPTVSAATTNTTICTGASALFTATPTNGGTTPTYQWTKNGTNISGATSATYSTTVIANNDQFRVVMTSSVTCKSAPTTTSAPVAMTVTPSVTPTVSAATPNTTICTGASALFTATPTNGGTTPTYQWTKNGTNISGATSATYSTTVIANNDQFRVVMTSSETCKSAATNTSAPVTMTVTPSVTPTVSAATPNTTICAGASALFTATPTNGGTTPTYQWTKNGTNISGATSATYSTTVIANNDQFRVVMTSSVTCKSAATATSASVTMTVTPSVTPTVSAATPNTTICAGASALFTATPTNGGTTPTYQWTKNGTNISGATSATYSTTVIANNDQFRVVMTSSETCKSAATATSAPVTMTLNNLPDQPGEILGPQGVHEGDLAIIYSTPSALDVNYVWEYTGTGVVIENTGAQASLDFSMSAESGTLSVRAQNSCGMSAAQTLDITVNVSTSRILAQNYGSLLACHPNPYSTDGAVHLNLDQASEINLSIIDMAGRICYTESITLGAGKHLFSYPSSLEDGVYLIHCRIGQELYVAKLIRQK